MMFTGQGTNGTSSFEEWLADVLGSETLASIIEPILIVLVVLTVAFVVNRLVRRLINRAVHAAKIPDGTITALRKRAGREVADERLARRVQRFEALGSVGRSTASIIVWGLAVMVALSAIGVPIAPLLASAGVLGLAIGFGAQDLVKDIIAGAFMLIEDQYGVGDIVDVGEATGVVEHIGLRSTRIRSLDGTLWHIGNGEITRVGNKSQQFARAVLDVGVAYEADVDEAIEVIRGAVHGLADDDEVGALVLEEPQVLGVENLGASDVAIRVVLTTLPGEQFTVSRAARRRIKYALDEAGIEIPFPQQTVWFRGDS
ncbi:MAG: mechanosensitive ion channel family protein [Nitriliruptorales bacterium]|nr:mechanosensitive ion channel family protein [Nitriliruptorales bacterium]